MNIHPVTVNLPKPLYNLIRKRAQQTKRSVESELLAVVTAAVASDETLPEELASLEAELALLDNDSLWRAARARMDSRLAAQLESLHEKRQREGLDSAEAQTLAGLVRQYERHMLLRAHAAALLKERGFDVSELISGK